MSRGTVVLLAVLFAGMAVFGIVAKGSADRQKKAAKVLDRYVEVTGGAQAYASIQTLIISGKGTFDGKPVEFEECRSAPSQYHGVMSNDEMALVETTDGTVAWTISGPKPNVLVGDSRAFMLWQAAIDRDVRWRDFFRSAEYKGTVDFQGKTCHKVVMTPREGKPRTRYYDVQTDLLVAEESVAPFRNIEPVTIVKTFDNYRKYGDILIPTSETEKVSNKTITLTVGSVQLNPRIPDEVYQQPSSVKMMLVAMPGYLRNAAGER